MKIIRCDFSFFYLASVFYNGSISDWCRIDFDREESNPLYGSANFYILNNYGEYDYIWELEIPRSIKKIKKYAFVGAKISRLIIHEEVESIDQSFVLGCHNLCEVYNLSSCDLSFLYCTIHNDISEESVLCIRDGYVFVIDSKKLFLINYFGKEKNIELPKFIYDGESISYDIGIYAFAGRDIISVKMGDHIRGAFDCAFVNCYELTNIELLKEMAYISDGIFLNCVNLKNVVLPKSIVSIQGSAFLITQVWKKLICQK